MQTRYVVKVTESNTDYGHQHEHTNKRRAIIHAIDHKGGLLQCSGGQVRVVDRQRKLVIWQWREGADGGYYQASEANPYPADPVCDLGESPE